MQVDHVILLHGVLLGYIGFGFCSNILFILKSFRPRTKIMDDGAYEIVDSEPFRAQMRRVGHLGLFPTSGTPLGGGTKNQQKGMG